MSRHRDRNKQSLILLLLMKGKTYYKLSTIFAPKMDRNVSIDSITLYSNLILQVVKSG